MRRAVLFLLLLVVGPAACAGDRATCPPCPPAATAENANAEADVKAVAARAFALIKAGDSAGLHALFDADMKKAVSPEKMSETLAQLTAAHGAPRELEPLAVDGDRGRFRVRTERGEWHLQVVIDDVGAIRGMLVKPPEEDRKNAPVARSRLPLGLPFRGTWFVFWGGETRALNYHVDTPSQRRATDLVVVDDKGSSFRGDGRANRDYFAYGRPVLAAAAGVVVTVVDGVPDNTPGEMNAMMATGNLIVVDHGGGVHSAYAHLVPGSAKVKVGAAVERGQVLGACGNTGNSSEPHLHFQLMDGPGFDKSLGIEPVFAGVEVTRDGARARQAEYTWRKGDRVHAPE